MKQLLFLSLLLLAACTPAKKEYTVIREQARPAAVVTEPQTQAPTCPLKNNPCAALSAQMTPSAPVYYTGTYTMQQPTVQFVMPAEMAYPAQPIMAAPQPTYAYAETTQPYVMQNIPTQPMMQQPQNIPMQPTPMPQPQNVTVSEDMTVIILQHPANRDLAKCGFNDQTCLSSYEAQGYIQLRNAPHFAGYRDVPSDSDYPSRRWRENNDVPRW